MSIATCTGDDGSTALIGGIRVSKSDLRVEAYGTLDELNAAMGMARSLCTDGEIAAATEAIQRTLFRVGAALSRPSGDSRAGEDVQSADVEGLTAQVHRLEALDGVLSDWSLPGAHPQSAAFELARTICRRAERCIVRLQESGQTVPAVVLHYVNRLSDLLWLFGRVIEQRAKVDSRLRSPETAGPSWSRAW